MENLPDTHSLVNTSFHCPGGRKKLKEVSNAAAQAMQMQHPDRVSSTVDMWETPALKEIKSVQAMARNAIKSITTCWEERGWRLAANKRLDEIEKIKDECVLECSRLWQQFEIEYPERCNADRTEQGLAFDEKYYPPIEALKAKMSVSLEYSVVPDPDHDVRSGWPSDRQERMKSSLIKQNERKVQAVMDEVVGKAVAALSDLAKKMDTYDGKREGSWKETLIPNLREVATLMNDFNLSNDPGMNEAIQNVVRNLTTLDSKELRKDPELRKSTAINARKALNQMGDFGRALND